jgi:RNA polymerase sigma-70 factor, ECF subfamily
VYSHSQTATHTTLLARVSAGVDPQAWVEFCDRYGDLIAAFCRRQGLQPEDVDDVRQDVLLALTRAMPGFTYDPAKGKFRSYLKTIVLHAIYRKSFQKTRARPLEEAEDATRVGAADQGIDQQWEVEWRQYHLRTAMRSVANEFNEADMAAFERYAMEGQDARTVAAGLSLTLDQVYQAKSRILKRIADIIERQIEEEG